MYLLIAGNDTVPISVWRGGDIMGGANGTDDTATAVPLSNVVRQRLHLPYRF